MQARQVESSPQAPGPVADTVAAVVAAAAAVSSGEPREQWHALQSLLSMVGEAPVHASRAAVQPEAPAGRGVQVEVRST